MSLLARPFSNVLARPARSLRTVRRAFADTRFKKMAIYGHMAIYPGMAVGVLAASVMFSVPWAAIGLCCASVVAASGIGWYVGALKHEKYLARGETSIDSYTLHGAEKDLGRVISVNNHLQGLAARYNACACKRRQKRLCAAMQKHGDDARKVMKRLRIFEPSGRRTPEFPFDPFRLLQK